MPSSVIAAMHYNASRRLLTIVYRGDRGRYRYFDVPPEVWEAFRTAKSKGAYLNEVFKGKGYRYEKVSEAPNPVDSSGTWNSESRGGAR